MLDLSPARHGKWREISFSRVMTCQARLSTTKDDKCAKLSWRSTASHPQRTVHAGWAGRRDQPRSFAERIGAGANLASARWATQRKFAGLTAEPFWRSSCADRAKDFDRQIQRTDHARMVGSIRSQPDLGAQSRPWPLRASASPLGRGLLHRNCLTM